jgi:hypothetical protein
MEICKNLISVQNQKEFDESFLVRADCPSLQFALSCQCGTRRQNPGNARIQPFFLVVSTPHHATVSADDVEMNSIASAVDKETAQLQRDVAESAAAEHEHEPMRWEVDGESGIWDMCIVFDVEERPTNEKVRVGNGANGLGFFFFFFFFFLVFRSHTLSFSSLLVGTKCARSAASCCIS